ncbi:MAG: hypothetical protein JNL75_04010 [Chitinophagales bacterium]|nr:hypothetical protein [Chitinophagales bacterium]
MQSFSWKFWGAILVSFLLGWGLSYITHTKSIKIEDKRVFENTAQSSQGFSTASKHESSQTGANKSEVPAYVLETLEYILEHNEAPSGYVGGRTFQNRERLLPQTSNSGQKYTYREWDVHPKVQGQNRGAERLVTSNEQDAYYTSDHYRSFQKIK